MTIETNEAPTTPTKSWRDALDIHPAADRFPLWAKVAPEHLKKMADDILANGLHIPITVVETTTYATEKDKKGVTTYQLLDGRNRLDACDLAGVNLLSDPLHNCGIVKVFEIKQDGKTRIIAHKPINVRKQSVHMWRSDVQEQIDKNDAENRAHVASINIHRRHLTVEERQDLLIELVALSPEKSDRQHAKEAGVDHKTIGKARAKGEQLGKVPQLGKRTGTDGKARKQPTKKTATKKTTKSAEAKALANVIKNATAAADNLAKANGIEPPKPPAPSRNDVGPSSTGEIQRKLARLEELEPEVVKLRQAGARERGRGVEGRRRPARRQDRQA
jgi:ParB/Sulfiredoxin domain